MEMFQETIGMSPQKNSYHLPKKVSLTLSREESQPEKGS